MFRPNNFDSIVLAVYMYLLQFVKDFDINKYAFIYLSFLIMYHKKDPFVRNSGFRIPTREANQRTEGPVNAHLIS